MKILSWNINGYKACTKHGGIDIVFNENPEFICLQEVKLSSAEPLFNFTTMDYFCYSNLSNEKGRSGVSIFSLAEPKRINMLIGFERFDKEGRFVELGFDNFTLINVYMPHGQRDKSNLLYKLESYDALISYLSSKNCHTILLVGDFNIAHEVIDVTRASDNKNNTMFTIEERKRLCSLMDLGFVDSFREKNKETIQYSWFPYAFEARKKNIGWRIDYIFIGSELAKSEYSAFIHNGIIGSDHCPIGINIA
jgi:exodeoxyribonuclease-3